MYSLVRSIFIILFKFAQRGNLRILLFFSPPSTDFRKIIRLVGVYIYSEPSPSLSRMKIIPGAMHVCHTILVRGNHYQRKTMKDESSNVLIAVILGYLEFFIFFFFFFERLGIYLCRDPADALPCFLATHGRWMSNML